MPTSRTSSLLKSELEIHRKSNAFRFEYPYEPQSGARVVVKGKSVLTMAAHDYLGLSRHPAVVAAMNKAIEKFQITASASRFSGGTLPVHHRLEERISGLLETSDTVLFPTYRDARRSVLSTFVNHAFEKKTIVDHFIFADEYAMFETQEMLDSAEANFAVHHYSHLDYKELEASLRRDAKAPRAMRFIFSKGYYPETGEIDQLSRLVSLAKKYDATLILDDMRSMGVFGEHGRGLTDYLKIRGNVDLILGSLDKAIGAIGGGYISGKYELTEFLRQFSLPYIAAPNLSPLAAHGAYAALTVLGKNPALVKKVLSSARYFRTQLQAMGYQILYGEHPSIFISVGSITLAKKFFSTLLSAGVYAGTAWYPLTEPDAAYINANVSALHSRSDLDFALEAFEATGKKLNLL